MKKNFSLIFCILLLLCASSHAGEEYVRKRKELTSQGFSMHQSYTAEHISLSHNSVKAIESELKEERFRKHLAESLNLSFPTAKKPEILLLEFRRAGKIAIGTILAKPNGVPQDVLNTMLEKIKIYVKGRLGGHSKDYMYASLVRREQPEAPAEKDLEILLKKYPLIPPQWVTKVPSEPFCAKARWRPHSVAYIIIDGEVAWKYSLSFKHFHQLDYIYDSKRDAKEYNPKYKDTIKSVEKEVKGQMEKEGTYGQFGSSHTFWDLKKEKLKAKGISWRSPPELNPSTNFD